MSGSALELTPVIIPALNEASYIARILSCLPADAVEPIVAVNGSTDRTAQIAEQFGATVVNSPEQGKLPIIQKVLKGLGDRATSPLIILDADSYPLFPRSWHRSMIADLTRSDGVPRAVSGPAWYVEGSLAYGFVHSSRRLRHAYMSTRSTEYLPVCGPNMALNLYDKETLEELLELPHIWPREDLAMAGVVMGRGGELHQSFTLSKLVISPLSKSFPTLRESLRMGKDASRRVSHQAYVDRGAPGSITYGAYRDAHRVAKP